MDLTGTLLIVFVFLIYINITESVPAKSENLPLSTYWFVFIWSSQYFHKPYRSLMRVILVLNEDSSP